MDRGECPLVEELSPAPDVADALEALAAWPGVALLDSALQRDPVGQYSFLTADPFQRTIHSAPPDSALPSASEPLRPLRELALRFAADPVPDLPPFQGGCVGMLSYDLGRAWERIPPPRCDEFELPVLAAGLYDWVLAWDHKREKAWIIAQGFPETERARRTDRAAFRIKQVRSSLSQPCAPTRGEQARRRTSPPVHQSLLHLRNPKSEIRDLLPSLPDLTSNFSRDDYLRTIERAIEYIRAGDIFQVNLAQRLLYPLGEEPLDVYLRLRECNPAPFAGYFAFDDWVVASASPERFGSVDGAEVETRPIKGTRRRRPAPEADLFTRDELRESEKDQAENVMIVDLLRNDLSRVCRPGSIRVLGLCCVETYETVQHLVSEIRGQLQPGRTAWDLFPAVFPGGSITGAPKVRAMEIIAELEPTARGPYCGSLFYVGFDGRADSNILIRTFTIKDGWIQFPVGGGIVAQSDPASEYAETWHKAEGMVRALR
jgi:para-aminobenzoate synthetase component 1